MLRGARVVHRLPGRVRVRFDAGAAVHGWGVANSLAGHPHVRGVTWNAANRSLVVSHDPEVPASAILSEVRTGEQALPPPPRLSGLDRSLVRAGAELLLPQPVQLALLVAALLRGQVEAIPVKPSTQ